VQQELDRKMIASIVHKENEQLRELERQNELLQNLDKRDKVSKKFERMQRRYRREKTAENY